MVASFRAAAVQMSSSEDKAANLRAAVTLVEQAAAGGAQFVVLPEMFLCLGRPAQILASAESIPGPTSAGLCDLARRLRITLVAGSYCERSPVAGKGFNTSLLINPGGMILARYRKRHLFDLDIAGQVHCRESDWLLAGDEVCSTNTPCGPVGQAICFDLRFADLFRQLIDAGSEILCIPSAFMLATGRDHWEVLLRPRHREPGLRHRGESVRAAAPGSRRTAARWLSILGAQCWRRPRTAWA